MPRRPRGPATDSVYHVLNRALRRARLFETDDDYAAFEWALLQTVQRIPLRLLAYSAMPNHWHLVLWPNSGMRSAPAWCHEPKTGGGRVSGGDAIFALITS